MKTQKITPAAFKKSIQEILEKTLQENLGGLNEHTLIKFALRPIEGKNFTSKHEKLLPPAYTVKNYAGMTSITGPDPEKRSHLLLWNTDPIYTELKFERADSCYFTGTQERIKQCEGLLKEVPNIASVFFTLKNHFDAVKKVALEIENGAFDSYNNPVYYELLTLCGINSKIMQDIKYNKI